MSIVTYHLLHLLGLICVFVGFGALMSPERSKGAAIWHGIGLLISLVTGFGLLAKLGIFKAMPTWVWIKIGLWVVLGILPVLAKRRVLSRCAVVGIAVIIGVAMAYLGYTKPSF
jgi:hypothetical protein